MLNFIYKKRQRQDEAKESEIGYDPETNTHYNKGLFSEEGIKEEVSSNKSKYNEENDDNLETKRPKEKKKNKQKNQITLSEDKIRPFEHDATDDFSKKPEENLEYYKEKDNNEVLKTDLNDFFGRILQKKQMINAAKRFSQQNLLYLLNKDNFFNSPKNAEKFNFILTIIRKQKPLSFYERPEILRTLDFINDNLKNLSPENVSEYCVNLSKMGIDKMEYYKNLEDYILSHSYKFNIRALANITHSFIFISKKQNVLTDFQHMFQELETIIALKIKQMDISEIDTKSINQIMIAYSKTQNFSKEFLYFLEQICLEIFDRFNPQEISNILYSFSRNKYECNTLLDKLG